MGISLLVVSLLATARAETARRIITGTVLVADVQHSRDASPSGPHVRYALALDTTGEIVELENAPPGLSLPNLTSNGDRLTISSGRMSGGALRIDDDATVTVTRAPHDHRRRRRAVAIGVKTVLVVRANAADESSTPSNEDALRDSIFGVLRGAGTPDAHNLKSQYFACSNGKLTFNPFDGVTTSGYDVDMGVVTVNIGRVNNKADSQVRAEMVSAATTLLGDLASQFNHVMLCMPQGTRGNWIAYAYLNQ